MAGGEDGATVAILFLTLGTLPSTASPRPGPPPTVSIDEARAHLNGLNLQRGCSPLWEQKEVTGSESLLQAQEWQEFSDFNSLRK